MIVERLHAIQEEHGYLPAADLARVAAEAGVPLYRVQEVISFFPHFRPEWARPARVEVKVCRDMACHLRGAADLLKAGLGDLHRDGDMHVEGVSCLGRCDRAPACSVSRHGPDGSFHDHVYAGRTPDELRRIVQGVIAGDDPAPADTDCGYTPHGDPDTWQIDVYRHLPGLGDRTYAAVRGYLQEFRAPVLPPARRPPLPNGATAEEARAAEAAAADDLRAALDRHTWLARLDPARLLGMGGAGVPAHTKWTDVWRADGPEKYVVCNGDESEPGTFKDRELLLRTPHLVVEGVILAGLLTNATAGYVFIRHEYGEQIAAVRAEIARAVGLRACGPNIFGSGRDFPVEVFVSPGGYICGEQSALLEAMEDRRAQPRNRPPELATNGLRDKPTLVNNVETLAWAPAVFLRHDARAEAAARELVERDLTAAAERKLADAADDTGRKKVRDDLRRAVQDAARQAAVDASWYAREGKPGHRGRRLFSISGDLERPGVYEVPIGLTLGELIDLAGGVQDRRPLGAVAPSGPSGGLLPPTLPVADGLDGRLKGKPEPLARVIRDGVAAGKGRFDVRALPLDLHLFREVGPILGIKSGLMLGAGLVVYAGPLDRSQALAQAVNLTEFFRNESCGKCVPCRLGSQKLVEIGTRLANGLPPADRDRAVTDVSDLASALGQTSICGLGVVAPNPLSTALELF